MSKIYWFFICPIVFLASCQNNKKSNLILPAIFSDHAVMQQDTTIIIWGWATEKTKIKINTGWGEKTRTKADKNGCWQTHLNTPSSGKAYQIVVETKDTLITIKDVLPGEVWLCGGQSNMNMPMKGFGNSMVVDNPQGEMAKANYPEIRQFLVRNSHHIFEQKDVRGEWKICTPEDIPNFSAVGYYFAKSIHQNLDVPVGLIKSCDGGTPAESWMSAEGFKGKKSLANYLEEINDLRMSDSLLSNWLWNLKNGKIPFHDRNKDNPAWETIEANKNTFVNQDYDYSAWENAQLPTVLEQSGIPSLAFFDGVLWLKKEVALPGGWKNKNLELSLGKITAEDEVWFNGTPVGKTSGNGLWKINRNYNIPRELVQEGNNQVTIRLLNWAGEAGFKSSAKAMSISLKGNSTTSISMSGDWAIFHEFELFKDTLYSFQVEGNNYFERPPVKGSFVHRSPTGYYNGMIAPLIPFNIKGAIFYQGEANSRRIQGVDAYGELFPAMIADWRKSWGSDFPFYYVQIAPFEYGDSENAAYLRDAQRKSLFMKNTGMAVTLDIGNPDDIHPTHKDKVGERLALWALNGAYKKDIGAISGPLYKQTKTDGNRLILSFDHANGGLELKETKINEFELAGDDGVFYPAQTQVDGENLILVSEKVGAPVKARYAWRNAPEASLFNKAGLPASSFITE